MVQILVTQMIWESEDQLPGWPLYIAGRSMPRGGVHNPGITPASICFADPSRRDIKQKHTNNRPFNAIKATLRGN